MANPYRHHVEGKNLKSLLQEGPDQLQRLAEQLGPKGLERSLAPGKWPARAILCHLADSELAFSFRLRQVLAEDGHVIQPFDQGAWAKHYGTLDASAALELHSALRKWNLLLIESIAAQDWDRPATHPERGATTFREVIETIAGHEQHHLRQLEHLAAT